MHQFFFPRFTTEIFCRLPPVFHSKSIRDQELLALTTADMEMGMYPPPSSRRQLRSTPSMTNLGSMNSELYSFRTRLTGLQSEADTDKTDDEGGGSFDDSSCVAVVRSCQSRSIVRIVALILFHSRLATTLL